MLINLKKINIERVIFWKSLQISSQVAKKHYFFLCSAVLESEVKWALESIILNKPSGGDGIPVELFSNPKR